MQIALTQANRILVFILPLSLVFFLYLLTKSAIFQTQPGPFSVGITLDLLLTLPLLYFLLIRKRDIPKITVASVFILGMITATYIIPAEHQSFLSQIKVIAIPLAELIIVSFVLYNTYRTFREYKAKKQQSPDFFTALKEACQKIFPGKLSHVLATEIAVIYYSFFSRSKANQPQENTFTYHRKSGIITVVYALFFIVAIETFVAHFLIQKWNPTVAWVLTGLSVYTCLQIFALTRSMSRRLIELDTERGLLHLRYGFFNETSIPLASIERTELSRKSLPEDKSVVQFSPLGILDTHNTIIHLRTEQPMTRIYGIQKKYRALAIYVDDKEKFVKALQHVIDQNAV